MKITDGSNRVIGTFCDEETGRSVLVNDTVAFLTFKTNEYLSSHGFCLSFSFLPRGELRACFRRSCCFMIAGMQTLVSFCPFFLVTVPSLVDSLRNTYGSMKC